MASPILLLRPRPTIVAITAGLGRTRATPTIRTRSSAAGHGFFGAVSKGLASAVEYAFKSEGVPTATSSARMRAARSLSDCATARSTLFTKDAGDHKVYWQGPSFGYDAGAEGSKTMVLVYNLRDPGEIDNRFGGAEGSAYLVGGVSVQFQKYGDVDARDHPGRASVCASAPTLDI